MKSMTQIYFFLFVCFVFQVVHVFLFFYFILKKKKKTFCILDTKHQVTNLAE